MNAFKIAQEERDRVDKSTRASSAERFDRLYQLNLTIANRAMSIATSIKKVQLLSYEELQIIKTELIQVNFYNNITYFEIHSHSPSTLI